MPSQQELGFTTQQQEILKRINNLAKTLEILNNQGQARQVICMLEALSNPYIDPLYIKEKLGTIIIPETASQPLTFSKRNRGTEKLSPEEIFRIRELKNQKKTLNYIVNETGVSMPTAIKYTKGIKVGQGITGQNTGEVREPLSAVHSP